MVMCNVENVPRPPALPLGLLFAGPSEKAPPLPPPLRLPDPKPEARIPRSSSVRSKTSNHSHGFRLLEQDDAGSVYSVYKQKIDSMFESDSSSNTKNCVQARIEKMFTDVALDTGIPLGKIGVHSFSVDYLGSVPLQEKVTSLGGLQVPLRELYFPYKRVTDHRSAMTGRLEISSQGLRVQYQGETGDLEQTNPFQTIAVWSAVKFVIHDNPQKSCAFLPLITDPDNIDKQNLFRPLRDNEKKYITLDSHSPLFAVVMRKSGAHKQLECHGFVCQTSEDAIVIAATLYKSLMYHMKAKEKRPKNRNGVTCRSLASSNYNDVTNSQVPVRPPRKKRSTTSSVVSEADTTHDVSETRPLLTSNNKAPKKSIKNRRAPKAPPPPPKPPVDLDAILPYEEPDNSNDRNNNTRESYNNNNNDSTDRNQEAEHGELQEIKPKKFSDTINTFMTAEQKKLTAEIKQVMSEGTNRGLKRVQSLRRRSDESIRKKENAGDILTKVTIPRSGSFLNTGGLTRYKSKIYRKNGQATGGSPLGFSELFNEFRLQEGLHSLDEILGVIIDSEGMSFNDLKPIYKEFLLKLAVTLTKDELYQRSKAIMRRQKKKMMRRNNAARTGKNKSHHISIGSKFKRLKHIFQRSLRLKLDKSSKHTKSATSITFSKQIDNADDGKLPESSISTSSYDTRHFVPKEAQSGKKQTSRKKSIELQNISRRDRQSTSEDSDFFSVRKNRARLHTNLLNQNRNSSSGYVSCSECSYDSESCTCVSADKCYCSLGDKKQQKKHYRKIEQASHTVCKTEDKCFCSYDHTLTFCGCDTDSCAESNKCYCQVDQSKVLAEKLKQRGALPGEEPRASSTRHKKLCKRNSNTRSTRSLEYMHNPSEGYYEKLKSKSKSTTSKGKHVLPYDKMMETIMSHRMGVDYELFDITDGDLQSVRKCFYTRAVNEARRVGGHRPSSTRSHVSSKYGATSEKSMPAAASTEALSMKKSAEIAALFADIKLSQTTDITHLLPHQVPGSQSRSAYHNTYLDGAYSKPNKRSSGEMKAVDSLCQKMAQNSKYCSSKLNGRNNMYSTRNGLYTIQSQSDDSRKSSISEGRHDADREYENKPPFGKHGSIILSNSLEDSLGYLP